MIHKIYAIYDSKVEAYHQPFFSPSHGAALRSISDVVNGPDHPFSRHAEDYTMFYVGLFDDSDCRIATEKALEMVVKLHELKDNKS